MGKFAPFLPRKKIPRTPSQNLPLIRPCLGILLAQLAEQYGLVYELNFHEDGKYEN